MIDVTSPDRRPAPTSLRLLYLVIGAWTAAIGPFSAVILRAHGLDTVTIGLLSAAAAVSATLLVPAWGHLADVLLGRAYAFRLGVAIASVAAVALVLPLPPFLFAPIVASFGAFPVMFLAVSDALAVGALPAPERQYGAVRALASLAFAVGVILAGLLYDRSGYGAVPLVSLGWSIALIAIVGTVPDATRDPAVRARAAHHGGEDAAGRFGSVSRAISVQPRLLPFLAAMVVAHTGMLGATTFVGIRIVELGGQPSDVGLTFGIAAFAEIPGLMVAGWVTNRFGLRWLFALALVGSGLMVLSWGVLATPLAINVTRVVTGLGYGALTSARVVAIARLLPGPLQATGQTMAQAASFGLGNALGGVVGGGIYGALGPTAFFAVAGILAIAGAIGTWFVLHGPVGAASRSIPEPA